MNTFDGTATFRAQHQPHDAHNVRAIAGQYPVTGDGDTDTTTITRNEQQLDQPWVTIVWNDPVNLMSYVVFVLQQHFGYERSIAEHMMMQIHETGKSVVAVGTREAAERDTQALHRYGLWATFTQDSAGALDG